MGNARSRSWQSIRHTASIISLTALGCAPRDVAQKPPTGETPLNATAAPLTSAPTAPGAPPVGASEPSAPPQTSITEPSTLHALEAAGFDFGRIALGPAGETLLTAEDYAKRDAYRELVKVLTSDLSATRTRDPHLGVGMRHAHRLFDAHWLSSPKFRFELVGVVNRIDRRVFAPETCGEIRFVYRLAYATEVSGQTITSRAPMTVNVVRWLPPAAGDSCRPWVQRWQLPETNDAAALLARDELLFDAVKRTRPKSVEINFQSVRWPSTVRPNMAGHAEYVLRVFKPTLGEDGTVTSLSPGGLENTPDVSRLKRDRTLQRAFVAWLTKPEVLAEVDRGTVTVPDEYLATRAESFAPHGLARLGNRPYHSVLRQDDLASVDLSGYVSFSNATSLLRRLDALTCQGCHQTRSVAGFHFLGRDGTTREADAILVAHSAHFTDEIQRRTRYLEALLGEQTPDEFRPSAERGTRTLYGSHCGLDPDGPFAAWACPEAQRCVRLNEADVGQCQPIEPGAGDACETGTMRTNANSHRDFVSLNRHTACGGGVCERNRVGFPGGMCSSGCGALGEDEVCGGIAQLVEFNSCLAAKIPFQRCILENTRPGALRACSESAPCREDYVCAQLPDGKGGCIPPYFLFQLRVDGHVLD